MERLTEDSVLEGRAWIKRCASDCPHDGEYCGTDECPVLSAVSNKLGEYERAEEDGLLVRLPCKVGDIVYIITRFCSGGNINCGYTYECSECPEYEPILEYKEFEIAMLNHVGKTVFLTREEAEKKLEEMKNDGTDDNYRKYEK